MALRQNLLAWMAQNLIKSSNFNDVIPAASTTANASIANDAINIRTMNRVILKNGSDYSNSFIVEPTVAGSWLVGSDEYEQKIQYDTPNNVTKLVINLNTVNNVMDYLVSKGLTGNITVGTGPSTTRSLTIAQVKEQYGDMLMYDLATLDAYTLQYQRNCEISPYGNDGIVSLNTSTPYARRMYFHPEYNFQTTENPNAQGNWYEPWINGKNKNFCKNAFSQFYKKEAGL